jgi:hypothetical protein
MSIKVMQWVWDCSKSRGAGRLVLLAIADCAAEDGGNAYPSNAELQRKAGLTDRGVQLAIKALTELGELQVRINGGRRGTNMYRVVMKPCDRPTPERRSPPKDVRGPEQGSPPPPNVVPPTPEQRSPGTVLEPSLEPSVDLGADAPNAGKLLSDWIDWLKVKGIKTLPGTTRARYGKELRQALADGFSVQVIGKALQLLYNSGRASNPQLLPHILIQVQETKPVSGAPKPFAQANDEYKARKAEAEKLHSAVAQQLIDTGTPVTEAMKKADEARRTYMARDSMETNAGVPYIEGVILGEDQPKEVTGS